VREKAIYISFQPLEVPSAIPSKVISKNGVAISVATVEIVAKVQLSVFLKINIGRKS